MIVLIAGKQSQSIKKDNDFHFSHYNIINKSTSISKIDLYVLKIIFIHHAVYNLQAFQKTIKKCSKPNNFVFQANAFEMICLIEAN